MAVAKGPVEWLEDIEGDIRGFEQKAKSWMRVAVVANLRRAWDLSDEEADSVLDEYLTKSRRRDSRPWCCKCGENRASVMVESKCYCGACARRESERQR